MSATVKELGILSKTLSILDKETRIVFPLSSVNKIKAESLVNNDRDFFDANNKMEKDIAIAIGAALEKDPTILERTDAAAKIMEVAAVAARDTVVNRLESNGGDVTVRPLKQSTISAKGNSRVGVDKGSLLNEMRNIKPRVISS
jgi:hypothetical protein